MGDILVITSPKDKGGVATLAIGNPTDPILLDSMIPASSYIGWYYAGHVFLQGPLRTYDVLSDPPFARLDMVSCRNLLIYLQPAAQEPLHRVLEHRDEVRRPDDMHRHAETGAKAQQCAGIGGNVGLIEGEVERHDGLNPYGLIRMPL